MFKDLYRFLKEIDHNSTAEEIQTEIYNIGKKHYLSNLRDFFKIIYQVLLGQDQGPRLGSFIKLFGINETYNLIEKILKGEDLNNKS